MPANGAGQGPGDTRRLLQVVMVATMLGMLPIVGHNLIRGSMMTAYVLGFAMALMAAMIWLNRGGRFQLATGLALWGLLGCVTFLVAISPWGIRSTSLTAMPGLLVVGAMLMGGWHYLGFSSVVILVSLTLALLDQQGLLPNHGLNSNFGAAIDVTVIFSITAIAAGFLARNLRTVIDSSRADSARLAEQNLLIEHQRQVVEAQKAEIENLLHRSEEASRLKSEFLANMSHEVRTPMNAIIGMAQLALAEDPNPAHCEYLKTIVQSGEGLMVIMNDILDLSKIEAGHLSVVQEPFDLRRGVESVFRLLRLQAEQKGLEFGFTVDPELPAQLVGDVGRLRQVVVNLVGNAVKFTERGRVWMNVCGRREGASGQREGASGQWRLSFEVTDDGPGIPPDQLQKIFDPFRQVDGSASRRQGGAGLGLTISSKIAERMGGSIEVRSRAGVGSTFVLHAPFLEAGPVTGTIERRPAPGSSSAQRILVAEDNVVNQTLAKRMLEKLGHRVWLAPDGQAAVDMVLNERFDLVFMDVQMPNLDGFAAARAIRAAGFERLPIIAMTAHAMAGDREACLVAGMSDYVAKPITFESLAAAIARAQPSPPPPVKTGEVPSEAPISTPPSVRS